MRKISSELRGRVLSHIRDEYVKRGRPVSMSLDEIAKSVASWGKRGRPSLNDRISLRQKVFRVVRNLEDSGVLKVSKGRPNMYSIPASTIKAGRRATTALASDVEIKQALKQLVDAATIIAKHISK